MKKFVGLALAVFLVSGAVFAQSGVTFGFKFAWDEPVTRTDGSPFDPALEIDRYVLRCVSVRQEAEVSVPKGLATGSTFDWTDAVESGGLYDCKMKVVDIEGLESDWSNEVQVRRTARPAAPVLRAE